MQWQSVPYAHDGQIVGLLGGSFDPAHDGHVHITRSALARFGLDHVWWLVSPANPLKTRGPAPLDQRVANIHGSPSLTSKPDWERDTLPKRLRRFRRVFHGLNSFG